MAELLLLDNDERIVELLSWFLGERGFSIRVAHSFEEARERLAESRPDLLISDVDLGTASAVDELPRLSAEGVLPPTLVVSGYLDANVQAAILAVPEVLDTLAKPFEFPHLEEKVRSCLSRVASGEPRPAEVGTTADRALADLASAEDVPSAGASASGDVGDARSPGFGDEDDDDGWVEITGP